MLKPKTCITCGDRFTPKSGYQNHCYKHWKMPSEQAINYFAEVLEKKEESNNGFFSSLVEISPIPDAHKGYLKQHPNAFASLIRQEPKLKKPKKRRPYISQVKPFQFLTDEEWYKSEGYKKMHKIGVQANEKKILLEEKPA